MKTWTTIIYAICPVANEQRRFCGPNIKAPSRSLAHEYCQTNGLGYCHISDELVMEIDAKTGDETDYETPQLN